MPREKTTAAMAAVMMRVKTLGEGSAGKGSGKEGGVSQALESQDESQIRSASRQMN